MKTLKNLIKRFKTSNRGFTTVYIMLFLVVITTGIFSMIEMQGKSSTDNKVEGDRGKAKAMALSGLQEATYYVQQTSPGWYGTSSEQAVTANGVTIGSYDYTVAKSGSTYTVTANGYYPNKTTSDKYKVTYTATKTFTYTVPISQKGIVLLGATGTLVTEATNATATFNSSSNLIVASSPQPRFRLRRTRTSL